MEITLTIMSMALPKVEIPENPTEKEAEEYADLMNMGLDAVPLEMIAEFCAENIFGDRLNSEKESLFLTQAIDETEPLQAELVAKLSSKLEYHKLQPPDHFVIQAFRRKAGFSDRNDTDDQLGKYTIGICLKEFQQISHLNEHYLVSTSNYPCPQITPLFELDDKLPHVQRNITRLQFPNGQNTIKTRGYLSILVWAFWADNPMITNQDSMGDLSDIKTLLQAAKDKEFVEPENSPQPQDDPIEL